MKMSEIGKFYLENKDKIDFIESFCSKLEKVELSIGECGFCRPCIGLLWNDDYWIEYEYNSGLSPDHILTPNAYHKHNSICVLTSEDYAKTIEQGLNELFEWVKKISQYEVYLNTSGDPILKIRGDDSNGN